ncbi:MAG TPA: ATP-binding protein, partial [Pirellulales bacterium]|nr:ATP-binding protein [Pirellulales bacterium]
MSYQRRQAELELFLKQAGQLLDGPVRGVVLDWRCQEVVQQHVTLEMKTGITSELPLVDFLRDPRGHATMVGLERYRAALDGTTVRLVKVVNSFGPPQGDPLAGLWVVPREHYVRFYRFLRRKLREQMVETQPVPIMPAEDQRRLFDNTVGFLRRERELLRRYGVPLKRGVLLIGKPGNGKTMACRWLAAECGRAGLTWKHVTVDHYDVARSQGAAQMLFGLDEPGVILFDDFDLGMCSRGANGGGRDRSTLLEGLDGIERRHGVVYVFTTNTSIGQLDPAFLRRGRIDVIIYLHKPNAELRRRVIHEMWHADIRSALDVERVVAETEGLSFAELEELKKLLLLRFLDAGKWDWEWANQAFQAGARPPRARRSIGFAAGRNNARCLFPAAEGEKL